MDSLFQQDRQCQVVLLFESFEWAMQGDDSPVVPGTLVADIIFPTPGN